MTAPTEPRFSVIVPTYGRPDFLDEAIRSVLDQTVDDLEVVVVDDASPVPPSVPDDPRVRLVRRTTNGGAAAARNTGIAAARGRWLTFCDDDDLYLPHRLESTLPALHVAPIVLCWMSRLDDASRRPMLERWLEGDVQDELLTGPVPHVGTCTIDRTAVVRFDERFRVSEDVEWWVRLAAGSSVTTVGVVAYLFREHAGDRQTKRIEDRLRCRYALLDTHAEFFDARPLAAAYQWRRIGGFALALGDRRAARRAFRRALRLQPSLRDVVHLSRSLLPGRSRVAS